MGLFSRNSSSRSADVTWTDTKTGKKRTTEVHVANGGTFEKDGRGAIAGAHLGGLRDTDRVRIDSVNEKTSYGDHRDGRRW